MEPLNFLTRTTEELLFFLHRKKTEISCIEQPHRLLTQLRDHDLVPEKLFDNVKKMRSREQKEKGIYEVLDWVEKNKPQYMHQFWRCVFEDHILQLYPTLRTLRNSLLDASLVKKGDKQEIWKWPIYKTHLPVTCGDKEGTLCRDKMPRGEKCILSQGHWFTLNDFEKFAGKEKCKNWKLSICCRNTPLMKLIEEEHLQCPPMERRKRTCVQKNMNKLFPVSSSESSSEDSETSSSSVEESDAENFQEQGWRGGRTEIRGRVEEEEEDVADLSVFQAPSLPVTCVSLTGTLYKYRFATGMLLH
uniref:Nuclear body protein SP140-like protein n=1 Tax=Cyprinus carpio TaxID=7962 RepID=A0A8C1PI11_CYPCA